MKHIDGVMLKQMIISGANYLFNCYPEVDALNVFPVPDGDTGTNMNLTMQSGAKEVQNRGDTGVYEVARAFSKGLLMGARGNSGVILSQIFRGFAIGLEGQDVIDAMTLSAALSSGKDVAYKAVMRPVEGTILTVIREAADYLAEKVTPKMDVEKAFEIFYNEARASLNRTPELLPVLKEVGVVDSGGMGLCKVLHGFKKALRGEFVEKNMATAVSESQQIMAAANMEEEGEFGYCTEFIVRLPENPTEQGKKMFNEKRFTNVLASHGNSLVVVRDEDIVKVHVHTLHPGVVLTYAQQFGEFVKLKIENMSEQHTELVEKGSDPLKQNEEKEMAEYAIIAVAAGDGIEEKFKEYGATYIVSGGQTMNPSTEDFYAAIKHVHAKKVFLLPNNSNIVMAAKQACEVTDEGVEARVIETKTIPQGLVACMMFNPEGSFDDNEAEMKEAITNVKTGQVTFAIKDTNIDGVEVRKDEYIALHGKAIVCCNPSKVEATKIIIDGMIDEMSSICTLLVGEGATEEEVEEITSYINEKFEDVEVEVVQGNQPVYSFIIGVE